MTTASTYRQRQDIIQGMRCPNCGHTRWARKGEDSVQCQQCESVFKVRSLWAEMSDLPVTSPAEPEIHLEHPDFATLVLEYALLDQAERLDGIGAGSSALVDRGQRLQQLEDLLPADVCAAVQLLNDRAATHVAHEGRLRAALPLANTRIRELSVSTGGFPDAKD